MAIEVLRIDGVSTIQQNLANAMNEEWVDMKIYILDDEQTSINQMEKYIKEYADKMGVVMQSRGFTSAEKFLQEYEQSDEKPYLVIIRVEMKQMSGIEVARILREKGSAVRLIFTDVSDKYAMDAFDVHADGYLRKPVTYQGFANSMKRFQARFAIESHTVQVRAERSRVNLHTADIFFAEATGHNVWIYSKEGDYKTPLTMGKLTELMQEEKSFLPCGRSYLVNMAYIKQLEDEVIVMKNGSRIPIPVRLRKSVAENYRKYCNG